MRDYTKDAGNDHRNSNSQLKKEVLKRRTQSKATQIEFPVSTMIRCRPTAQSSELMASPDHWQAMLITDAAVLSISRNDSVCNPQRFPQEMSSRGITVYCAKRETLALSTPHPLPWHSARSFTKLRSFHTVKIGRPLCQERLRLHGENFIYANNRPFDTTLPLLAFPRI